jgi:hypothetical protein
MTMGSSIQQLGVISKALSLIKFSVFSKLVAPNVGGQLTPGVVLDPAAHCGCAGRMMNKG